MTEPLDAELDTLFQLPPEQLVAARNALSDRLRKSGDRAAATRVKALKRPTPAAWALNQVHFHAPELLRGALAQAQRLRELHAADGVDPAQLTAALEAQRHATHAIVDAALDRLHTIGQQPGPVVQRRLLSSVQGWLSGRADEAPGRMTQDLEAGGFDALTSVGTALPRVPIAVPSPTLVSSAPAVDPRREEASRELGAAEHAAKSAVERVRRSTAEHELRQRELERAHAAVHAAEAALNEQRTRLHERLRAAAAAQAELEAANTDSKAAEARVVRARRTLDTFRV